MNPLASGNKTISGLAGVVLTSIVAALLKKYGITDADGTLTVQVVGWVISGALTLVGAIHKVMKKKKAQPVSEK